MITGLLDAMTSLSDLMEEESALLGSSVRSPGLPEIAEAKSRLAGRIEAETTRLARETPGWMDAIDAESRETLTRASERLRDVSVVNAQILSRQIELSVDMMGAIAAEAKRITGTRNATYGAGGSLFGSDMPAPISINTRL